MACFIKFLLNFIQYHYMFYGFSYMYIDIGKCKVKFSVYMKIYVYFLNLIYSILSIYILMGTLIQTEIYFNVDSIMEISNNILQFARLFIFMGLIFLRIKEERLLKKWLKLFSHLQTTYFDQQSQLTLDTTAERFQIVNILLIFLLGYYNIYDITSELLNEKWSSFWQKSLYTIYPLMENYIMIHHIFILCCLKKCYSKLNNELKSGKIRNSFARIYIDTSFLLREVNILNGPIIFLVILSQLVQIPLNAHIQFEYFVMNGAIFIFDYLLLLFIMSLALNIFLYFLICDQLYKTIKETGEILRLYDAKNENHQVIELFFSNTITELLKFLFYLQIETVCRERLIFKPNIIICDLFTVDLGSLTVLINEIIKFSVILIQLNYVQNMNYKEEDDMLDDYNY